MWFDRTRDCAISTTRDRLRHRPRPRSGISIVSLPRFFLAHLADEEETICDHLYAPRSSISAWSASSSSSSLDLPGTDGSAGARAAGIAITRTIERLLTPRGGEGAVRNAILDGIEESNRVIRQLEVGAGTTILAIEIEGGCFRSYHAGDSMALLVDAKGRTPWRTPPHSPVGYAIEAGLLDEQRAMKHENRHLLANALGRG